MNIATSSNQAYNSYSQYIKNKYQERVQKISVHAGFTCPNRDGSKGVGGCTFCNNESFSYNSLSTESLRSQILQGISFYKRRFPELKKFIVYFQSYSNTYKPLEDLRSLYLDALSVEGVIGLSIGTRPDCLDAEKISFLQELSLKYDITLEIGLESFNDETLTRVNRCHSVADFFQALHMAKNRNIKLCTHLILGFPWENHQHYQHSLEQIKLLKVDFIKFHQLQIVKNTALGTMYIKTPFPVITKQEYFNLLAKHIANLHPSTVIQRLFSDYGSDFLLSPSWEQSQSVLTQEFTKYLSDNGITQGMNHLSSHLEKFTSIEEISPP